MKISFFIGKMIHGGAEKVISILANELCKAGHQVDIVLLLGNTVNYSLFTLDDRICFVDLSSSRKKYLSNILFWVRKIRRYLKSNKPDKVVSFIGRINCLVLLSSLGLGIPVIVSERSDPKHDGRGKFMLGLCNKMYKKAEAVVFQTNYEMSCFSPRLTNVSHIISNPVMTNETWNPSTSKDFIITTTGRLNKEKNHLMLLKSIKLLKDDGYNIKCIIYGDGDMRSTLENFIFENKLSDVVSLPGNKRDVCSLISTANLFVLTSYYEGLSNSLMEALSIGMPCISTSYNGAIELIEPFKNGLIVNIDDFYNLYRSIVFLIKNKEACLFLANNAKLSSERFKYDNVVNDWLKLITKQTIQ